MRKLFWLTILLVVLAAAFASTHSDGLDFVSEKLNFATRGTEQQAPQSGYLLPFLPAGGATTALAGIVGVLIILGIFRLVAFALKIGKPANQVSLFLCLILSFSLLGSSAEAARPLITDDFYTVTQGGYELELGYSSTQNQQNLTNYFGLSLKRGLLSNLDLGVEIPYTTSGSTGINDIYLHLKYQFWQKSNDEGMTLRLDYKFKNGNINQGLGSGDNDYWLLMIYSKMIGVTKVHLNLGYVNIGFNVGDPSDDYIAYLAALEYPFWGEYGDLVAEYVANNAAIAHPTFIQVGVRYRIKPGLKIDAGFSQGLNDKSIKNNLTYGLHYEF